MFDVRSYLLFVIGCLLIFFLFFLFLFNNIISIRMYMIDFPHVAFNTCVKRSCPPTDIFINDNKRLSY